MFIILKNDFVNKKKSIENIIYGNDSDKHVNNYLNEYLNDLSDDNKDESIVYFIDENAIKMKKTINNKGYLYNSTKFEITNVIELESIEYNPRFVDTTPKIDNKTLWENLNTEINNRVLKSMDKDSLYQIYVSLDNNLRLKHKWTRNDFINILNELLKNFKKELYSSVTKKLNRYKTRKTV
jgi:Mg/Co/Ni transporter MgtE